MGKLDNIVDSFFGEEENIYHKLTPKGHGLGFTPRLPDRRDAIYGASYETLQSLPAMVNLGVNMPEVLDQGQLGSCTSFGSSEAFMYELKKQGLPVFEMSQLAIYYWTRLAEGSQAYDSGAQVRDALTTLGTYGAPPAADWPYNISLFAQAPPEQAVTDAKKNIALKYELVPIDLDQMKACLAEGFPIVIGITVYESFESQATASTGIVPMPGANEAVIGGHCMLCYGYDDSTQLFRVRNSWGPSFGSAGDVLIPYAYLASSTYGSDYWKLELVS